MSNTIYPNTGVTGPEEGGATNVWGGLLNNDMEILDAIFAPDGTGTGMGFHANSGKVVKIDNGATLSAAATAVQIFDPGSPTKIATFNCNVMTTTRTFAFPDASGTLATQDYVNSSKTPTGTVLSGLFLTAPTGFVYCNNTSIGSSSSSATQRANADTQNLFNVLWQVTACFVGPGGRGVSAAADWAANKAVTTLDMRGRGVTTLDNNGGVASAAVLSPSGIASTTLGAAGGSATESAGVSGGCSVGVTVSGGFSGSISGQASGYEGGTIYDADGHSGASIIGADVILGVSGTCGGGFSGSGSGGGSISGSTSAVTNVMPVVVFATVMAL